MRNYVRSTHLREPALGVRHARWRAGSKTRCLVLAIFRLAWPLRRAEAKGAALADTVGGMSSLLRCLEVRVTIAMASLEVLDQA
jgi:hypothetical protein